MIFHLSMNYTETERSHPPHPFWALTEISQQFLVGYIEVFLHAVISQVAWCWSYFFPFTSRLIWKRGRGEEVSRSHFSFALDKLSQQRCSWEISYKKKNNTFWALILKLFFIPNSLTKGISMFYSFTELCISFLPWKGLETAEPARIPGWFDLTGGYTASCNRTLPRMPHAQATATPSHDLGLRSHHAALKNEKEMGRSYSSLAKNLNASGQAMRFFEYCRILQECTSV